MRVLVLALLPVTLAGAAIWLREGGAVVRVGRGLAIASAVLVSLFILLPEAYSEAGPWVLVVAGLGISVPSLVERVVRFSGADAGVRLIAAGMVLHQVLDGVQMGALGASVGGAGVLALGLHGLPLMAVVLMAVARDRMAPALALWAVFFLVTTVGFSVGASVPPDWMEVWEPWVQAGVAGVLLHVLSHDITSDDQEAAKA